MPVILTDKQYTDNFGNISTYYKVNAGDLATIVFEFETSIRANTQTSPMFLDASTNQITSASLNWLNEGFRDGDSVRFTRYSFGGSVLNQWTTTINSLTSSVMDVGTVPVWYNQSNNEFIVIEVTSRNRGDIDLFFNQVLNSTSGSRFSLIDAEPTRISFLGVDSMAVSDTISGINIPNQSGQFLCCADLTRNADPSTYSKSYSLIISANQSGVYDSTWFSTGECLKNYIELSWAAIDNEPFNRYPFTICENGDTGYFNMGYNSEIPNATLTNGISSIDYGVAGTYEISIESTEPYEGIGAAYVSIDSTYYKNNANSQLNLSMLFQTQLVSTTPIASYSNPDGAFYELALDTAVTNVGTSYNVQLNFIPDASFTTFMDGRAEGDRNMKIWCKFGNTNVLVFDDQLTTAGPSDGLLEMEQNIFLDHSENVTESTDTALTYEADTEDDLAFTGVFNLHKGWDIYNSFTASIIAYNTSTLEQFTLTSAFFNIASIPFDSQKYLINESVPVQSQLPTTSEKRNAILELAPDYDQLQTYGVRIYFPFLLRWEYWLQQTNAAIDFYPNEQTKNWYPYGNTGDWEIRLKLRLVADDFAEAFMDTIIDKDYSDKFDPIVQDIQLEVVSTSTIVSVIPIGEMIKVIATHTLNDGTIWNYPDVWGMITCEPFESAQRWISSTVIDYDYNNSNPLTPLPGYTKCKMTWTSPETITLECLFDQSKINVENGVSFTSKIKGCSSDQNPFKMKTDGTYKKMTDNQFKKLS